MNNKHLTKACSFMALIIAVCCSCIGCEEATSFEVVVEGSGDVATVKVVPPEPPRPHVVRLSDNHSLNNVFTAITEKHDGKKYIGQSVQMERGNVRVVARADSSSQGFEIIVDSTIPIVLKGTYRLPDGTAESWTKRLNAGKHFIREFRRVSR